MKLYYNDRLREFGGPGSGNFGHSGIPGERGGSAPGGGGEDAPAHGEDVSDDVLNDVFNLPADKMREVITNAFGEESSWDISTIDSIREGLESQNTKGGDLWEKGMATFSAEVRTEKEIGIVQIIYGKEILNNNGETVAIKGGKTIKTAVNSPTKIPISKGFTKWDKYYKFS